MRRSTVALVAITAVVVLVAVLLRNGDRVALPGNTTTTSPSSGTEPVDTIPTVNTTIPPVGLVLPSGTSVCELYGTLTVAGTVESTDLVEASGLVVSRTTAGVLWSHNDSRDGPRLYAFSPDGTDLGVFQVPGALALDWEDIAVGPGADGTGAYLYAGDIGDNFAIRDGIIAIHRVDDLDPTALTSAFPRSDPIPLAYPDGPHNAEAMFIDPIDPAVYVVTKDREIAKVYRGSIEITGERTEMDLVATLTLGAEVSGADISFDGSVIAFRGYQQVWMWHRTPGQSVADALGTDPCQAPGPKERQGEAIAFDASYSYFTISEDTSPAVYRIPFEG
jgi:hypothetical protein